MKCPRCPSVRCRVVDSRSSDDQAAIRRRRECLGCGFRYTTFERVEFDPLLVRKRSGDVVPFEREKIISGLRLATKGRTPSDDVLAEVAASVEAAAQFAGREICTDEIGRLVLAELRELDGVAYLRFASVHKSFDDPADFERELLELGGQAQS